MQKLLTIFCVGILASCILPPKKQAINQSLFSLNSIETASHTLHYAQSGELSNPPVVFIHGTPGDWTSFSDIMQTEYMQKNYNMYSIDRLGWGKSTSTTDSVEAAFKPHTDSIDALLRKIYQQTQQKIIVVGHSLGGSLAPRVAIASPNYVKALVIIAGNIDPKFGNPRWYHLLANLWLVKSILPNNLAKANDEMLPLKQELLITNARLDEIQVPVTIIHGTKDKLVNYDNVAYAEQAFKNLGDKLNLVSIQDAGHFLIWQNIPTIMDSIDKINSTNNITSLIPD